MNYGTGPEAARIMVIGEYYSQDDFHSQEPFSGQAGIEFNRMLHEAGIMRSECYLTNIVNGRPNNGLASDWIPKKKKDIRQGYHVQYKGVWLAKTVLDGWAQVQKEIARVSPNIIIACGELPLFLLTGASGPLKWRGSLLQARELPDQIPPKVIPILSPASIFSMWEYRNATVTDLKRVAQHRGSREMPKNRWNFVVRPSYEAVTRTINSLLSRAENETEPLWLDFDLETRAGHIACAGISWSLDDCISVPFMCVEDEYGYWGPDGETEIVFLLYTLLTHPNVRVRGQNLLYDCQYTWRWWKFIPRVAQDTMISHHTLFAALPKSLAFQASMYCNDYVYWKDDGKTWERDVGEDNLWRYNCEDCVRTRECGESSQAAITAYGLQEVDSFQQDMFWPVLSAMIRGVRIDKAKRKILDAALEKELAEREEYFKFVLGHPLNPKSPKQMQELFYGDLQQKVIMSKAKKGERPAPTCNDAALATIGERQPLLLPLIRKIQEYRSISVILNTFIRMPLDIDERMRTSYNICGTDTYRLSSSENAFNSGGNLQNWSKGGVDEESGLVMPNTRTLVIPDEGCEFFDTDLSKADLRVVVWESGAKELKAMLDEGRDPYIELAREFFRDPTISKKLPNGDENPKYKMFKSFAHGTHYLGTPRGLAQRLGLTVHEADRTQKWYFQRSPEIKAWQVKFVETLNRTRKVVNAFGYQHIYFDRITESTAREAIAWLPQSTVACVINRVWLNLYKNAPYIEVLLQTHDSLSGQFPSVRKAEAIEDFRKNSSIIIPYKEPLIIPIELKTSPNSWGEC